MKNKTNFIHPFLFIIGFILTSHSFAFDGLGFYIDIPPTWTKVLEQDDPSSNMRNYGFQGTKGEEFMIAVSLSNISEKQKLLYKTALRQTDGDSRQAQGLSISWQEKAAMRDNGETDSVISYQSQKNYTSCEHNIYGPNRMAIITLILNVKPDIAKSTCFQIIDSLKWRRLP